MAISPDLRTIWVATVPRTGSMWTYNVVRELVRSTGRTPLPEIVPQSDEDNEAIGRAGIAAGDGLYVVKLHARIPQDLPHSFFVVTHRDLRDAMISFMRFTKGDFHAGLRFVAGAMRMERHFSGFPDDRRLDIQYPDIVDRPAEVVAAIAGRLGIEASATTVAAILEGFSKEKVQERIAAREKALSERIAARQPVDRRDFVPMSETQIRAFDTATGFQSGHVSAYREGDWRKILSPAQQAEVEALMAEIRAREGD
ncbi:MAG TPA: sulfotransferase [Devosia sp.]|nr:sulfotransferase [Devosia sp.]